MGAYIGGALHALELEGLVYTAHLPIHAYHGVHIRKGVTRTEAPASCTQRLSRYTPRPQGTQQGYLIHALKLRPRVHIG